MSIGSELTYLNDTKGLIRSAIIAKGVAVPEATPFRDYADKIGDITSGGSTPSVVGSDWVWTRPSDWLALPSVTNGEEKVVILCAVFPSPQHNNVSLKFVVSAGNYVVDWGDGTSDTVAGGSQANHSYTYSSISASTECSRGYRQVIITVTPETGGAAITGLVWSQPSGYPATNAYGLIPFLDITAKGTFSTNFASDTYGFQYMGWLERIEFRPTGAITSLANGFKNCTNLRKVVISNVSNVTSLVNTFLNCTSLIDVSISDLGTISLASTFSGCFSLQSLTISTGVTDSNSMFLNCYSLREVTFTGTCTPTTTASMFSGCNALQKVSWTGFDGSVLTTTASMFDACYSLHTIEGFGGTDSSLTASTLMFRSCYSLLAAPTFTTNATDLTSMFQECRKITSLSNVTFSGSISSLASTFNGCTSLMEAPTLSIAAGCTCTATFSTCYALRSIANVTFGNRPGTCTTMFSGCYSLASVPPLSLNNPGSLANMFNNCVSLQEITLNVYTDNTGTTLSGISTASSMFSNCRSLQKLTLRAGINTPFSNFGLGSTTSALQTLDISGSVFLGGCSSFTLTSCGALTSISLPASFHANTTTVSFNSCTALQKVSGLSIAGMTSLASCFNACYCLREVNLTAAPTSTSLTTTNLFASSQSLARCVLPGIANSFSVANCSLSAAALDELYTSWPAS